MGNLVGLEVIGTPLDGKGVKGPEVAGCVVGKEVVGAAVGEDKIGVAVVGAAVVG